MIVGTKWLETPHNVIIYSSETQRQTISLDPPKEASLRKEVKGPHYHTAQP